MVGTSVAIGIDQEYHGPVVVDLVDGTIELEHLALDIELGGAVASPREANPSRA